MYLFQFGTVKAPGGSFGGVNDLPSLVNIILRTMIVGAALYAVFNFVLAGYGYLSAGGDSKQVQLAGAKITQSIIGLTVAAGAFVIAAVVGQLLFDDPNFLLQIRIFSLK